MKMRAVVVREPGGPEVLSVRETTIREPERGELRVHVRAAGVNRADLLQRRGRYPAPAGWPQEIPGLEYAGTIESSGPGVEMWRPGDRVMGLVGGGGYAEYVVVPEREALAVPERLSWEEAGAIPEAFITAHDALFRRLGLRLGERLLIHAVGSGVGTAALQLAKAAGAVVYGTSRTGWKLDRARELGLDLAIETSSSNGAFGDAIMEATGGQGVDAILELVGAPYLEENLECLRTLGRIVVVGLTAGSVAEVDLRSLLRKRATVVGTSLRTRPPEEKIEAARSFEREGVPLIAAGRVQPVVDRIYPLGEAEQAHRYMEENANFGKIVLSVSHGAAAK